MPMTSPEPPPRPERSFHPRARPPLGVRKRLERQAARQRIAAHTTRGLSDPQRALDPLLHRGRTLGAKALKAAGALLGSTGLHAAVVVVGLLIGGVRLGRREVIKEEVTVTVRERELPPPPPPPPPEKPPEPPKPAVVEKPAPPPMAKAPPPPAEAPKGPPPRVVGLSFESTAEGGSGPGFAVGNTRMGETAERAAEPKPADPAASEAAPTTEPAQVNRAASRIPTAGVAYTMPKRKHQRKPLYPETLKAQGIEEDVPVMVTLDASGKVIKVKILKETPYPELNESARQSALDEEYEPATRDGVPIPYTLSYTIRFRLEDE